MFQKAMGKSPENQDHPRRSMNHCEKTKTGVPDPSPIPEWQKEELDRRYAKYQRGELSLHDCQQVHRELLERQQTSATKKRKTNQQFPLAVPTGMAQQYLREDRENG